MRPPPPRLLVVDDEEDTCEIYKMTFEAEDFEVEIARDGLDGVTKTVDFKPDVILLDIMMPNMDGYEVLQVMRDNTSMNVVIVVLSNIAQDKDIELAKKAGADFYLAKADYDPDQVVEKVKELMKNKPTYM